MRKVFLRLVADAALVASILFLSAGTLAWCILLALAESRRPAEEMCRPALPPRPNCGQSPWGIGVEALALCCGLSCDSSHL